MSPTTTRTGSPALSPAGSAAGPSSSRPNAHGIDPRLSARRIAVQREEGRRRFRRLFVVGAVLGVALAGVGVTRTPLVDVDAVRIRGAQHTAVEAVAAATGIERGEPMTDVDLGRARRQVAALPWVSEVKIARHWLGTIEVVVRERVAVAAVAAAAGGWLLLDAEGHFLDVVPQPEVGIVALQGLTIDGAPGGRLGESGRDLLDLAAALPTTLLGKVTATSATPEGELQLGLGDGAIVRVGDTADLADKIIAVETIIARVDLTCLAVVDVRVASAPVLTRNRNCD